MLEKTKQYLENFLPKSGKYLLALSGGPDSMALFQLLFLGGWQFEIAHVNHGWRKESQEEALFLHEMANSHGVVFHLHEINKEAFMGSNWEDEARNLRIAFFKQVYDSQGIDALLLGHQADDQVETILKRVFEGSFLQNIPAMKNESCLSGMKVVRPLLFHFKSEILSYLQQEKIHFFEDYTNYDDRFLRARMRNTMIPYLEEVFGKGIKENVILLGERIEKCTEYLKKQVNDKMTHIHEGPLGYYVPTNLLKEELEMESLLRKLFHKEGIDISKEEVKRLLAIVAEERDQKKVIKGDWNIVLERDHLFILRLPKEPLITLDPLPAYRTPNDWKSVFSGTSAVFIPDSDCTLRAPKLNAKMQNGVLLKEWYRLHKVPVFLRPWFPVIWKNGVVMGECLTGKHCVTDQPVYANHLLTLKGERGTIGDCSKEK